MNATNTAFVLVRPLAIVLGAASIQGCYELGVENDGLTRRDYDEVATAMGAIISDEARGELNAFGGAVLLARGAVPANFKLEGGVCSGETQGLAYSLSAVCSDELGRGDDCDANAATAHVEVAWAGDFNAAGGGVTSKFDGDWVLEDLKEQSVLLGGHARATASMAGDGSNWGFDYTAWYDVGIDRSTRRATSGVAVYNIVAKRLGGKVEPIYNIEAELSFNANGSATLVFDGDHTFEVLGNGTVRRVSSK